jgi:hypothetical protein
MGEDEVNLQFTYIPRISHEADFELPENVSKEILRLDGYLKSDLLSGKRKVLPETIYNLRVALSSHNSILSVNEIKQYLEELYDPESGGYKSFRIATSGDNTSSETNAVPVYVTVPDIVQTYAAVLLLSEIGENLPDKHQTLNFILSCKRKFGFSRWSDGEDINIISTFAGVMLLKNLSK